LDADDGFFLTRYGSERLMTRFGMAFSSTSPTCMMDLGDGQLKRIVHFKLFVAVEGLSQSLEQGIQPSATFSQIPRA